MEEMRVESEARFAELLRVRQEGEQLRVRLAAQTAETHHVIERWAGAKRDRMALREERENLYRELAAWQARVRDMEGSRAWRLRARLLAVLRALHLQAAEAQPHGNGGGRPSGGCPKN